MINLKKDNGSVTLFIILTGLVFTSMLLSSYTYLSNQEKSIEQEYYQIKSNYEIDLGREQELYEAIISAEAEQTLNITENNIDLQSENNIENTLTEESSENIVSNVNAQNTGTNEEMVNVENSESINTMN